MHIKLAFQATSQGRRPQLLKAVQVIVRDYKWALPSSEEEIEGKLRRKDERSGKAERGGSYFAGDGTTIRVDEIARGADASVRRSSTGSFVFMMVERFEKSSLQIFLRLFRKVAAQFYENVPETVVLLTFRKSGYMVWVCIPRCRDIDL